MISKLKIFIILFVLIFFSINAISAENFSDLQKDIDESVNIFNLTKDYTFNNDTDVDYINGTKINKTNYIINGNGHYIDGNNQAKLFQILNGTNITMNNLNFINGNDEKYFLIENSSIFLNNIEFKNNKGYIDITNSNSTITNSNFIHNINLETSNYKIKTNLRISNSEVTINSSNFKEGITILGEIWTENNAKLNIFNCNFYNLISNFSSSINSRGSFLKVNNSNFYNINIKQSAGAITVYNHAFLIDNCKFENITAPQNGGAIVLNLCYSDSLKNYTISNSNFTKCKSGYGGAILYLGTRESNNIIINNCIFNNNSATFNGGAIYSSYAKLNITNCIFNKNNAGFNGGTIYADMNTLNVINTFINNNFAKINGSGIYVYESTLNIIKSFLDNNDEYGIYGVFLKNFTSIDSKINDKISLNNTEFKTVIIGKGANLNFVNKTIIITNMTKFDLREYGLVTPAKKQGTVGSCWTFGLLSALESALLLRTNKSYDLSENNIKDLMIRYSKYGCKIPEEGNYALSALSYILNWFGVIEENYDPYDLVGKISPILNTNKNIHIQDAIIINARKNATDNDIIKNTLIKYGGINTFYHHEKSLLNLDTNAYYYNGTKESNHAVCIIGWDDNYSKDNFLITPPGDGAFIVKNSWGDDWAENGFFYVSYYDTVFARESNSIAFILENNISYNKNYQIDFTGFTSDFYQDSKNFITINDSEINYYGNKFISVDDDSIAAIGTYFNQSGVEYEISIYINNELKYIQNGLSSFSGFTTIKLNKYIPIKENDILFVSIKSNKIPISSLSEIRTKVDKNTSFFSIDGKNWIDMYTNQSIACLKVYTVENIFNVTDLNKYYGDNEKFHAELGIANETVIFEINGVNYTKITNKNGIASIAINLNPGKYNITTYALNQAKINMITIETTINGNDVVKYYKNNTQYFVKFLDNAGNVLKNTNVIFNINGIFYTRTTNDEGIAKLNINLNAGNYTITSYNSLTKEKSSNSIFVLSTIEGNNITKMYQNDTQYFAKFLDNTGKSLKNTIVTFNINGVFYTRTTNDKGIAKLNINLNVGKYIITAINPINNETNFNIINVLPLIKANDINMTSQNKTPFIAKLFDKAGKTVAGKTINFNINGIIYSKITDANGIAKLDINLIPGEYIITSENDGFKTSNKIIIRG